MNTLTTQRKHEDHSADYVGLAGLIYLLQALAFFLGGMTFIVAVILNYLNMHHVKGTWVESHFKWQIETFWVALALVLIGSSTLPFLIGFVVIFGAVIWIIHRIVYGWVSLNKSKEVTPKSRFPLI